MRKSLRLSAVCALLLGGCGPLPRLTADSPRTQPIESFYTDQAVTHDLRLTVRGRIEGIDQAALERRVETITSGGGMISPPPRIRLAPEPGSLESSSSLVVVFMNGPRTSGQQACDGKGGGLSEDGHLWAVMAFCVGGRAVSEVTGDVSPEQRGLDDPALSALLRQMTLAVFRTDDKGSRTTSDQ